MAEPAKEHSTGHELPMRITSAEMYATVAQEGDDEMQRPAASLWWSGVAAGLGISASLLGQGFLRDAIPEIPGRDAIIPLGYSIGFLLVICARLQLFTENTITPVLPLLDHPSWNNLLRTARLWGIVLVANTVGTLIAAWVLSALPVVKPEQLTTLLEVARHFASRSPTEAFFQGIPAGFFVAAMVWMMTGNRGSQILIILIMTYLIALGEFAHVVVGGVEVFLLILEDQQGLLQGILLLLATGAGNILGGTGLFALLAYGQVAGELK